MPGLSHSKNGVASLAYGAGHPRLTSDESKTWMAGTSPAMTLQIGQCKRWGKIIGCLAIAFAIALTVSDAAFACRGYRNWSTGTDLAKLKPGEIVVQAQLLEAYKNEERFPAIMGIAHGFIYYLHITEVRGGASGTDAEQARLRDVKIYVRLNPSVCEAYFPLDFMKGTARILVLKMGPTGLYHLVGGQERDG